MHYNDPEQIANNEHQVVIYMSTDLTRPKRKGKHPVEPMVMSVKKSKNFPLYDQRQMMEYETKYFNQFPQIMELPAERYYLVTFKHTGHTKPSKTNKQGHVVEIVGDIKDVTYHKNELYQLH